MLENRDGLMALTVSQAVAQLSHAYISLIRSGTPLKAFPSVMLWGAPGVGKSQGIRQVAGKIEKETGKRVVVTDVRLLLFNPVDLRGIPTANADRTLAVWLKPQIFQMDPSPEVVNILFLDEISAAPQSVQAAAYQITLDRTVGEHRLPENCIVIAAGNRVTDKSVAYAMPKALANRLCHMEIVGEAGSWQRWAERAGVHPVVRSFLHRYPDRLMQFDAQSEGLAFATPRSWEMVSNILNHVSEDIRAVMPLVIGCVGERTAHELLEWSLAFDRLPEMEAIFGGKTHHVPSRPEALFALVAKICQYAATHTTSAEIGNALHYVSDLPQEFRERAYIGLLEIPSIRRWLLLDYGYNMWFERSGRDWSDYGL